MRKFTTLSFFYACLCASVNADVANVTDVNATAVNLTSLSRELLGLLCPFVDICDQDATSVEVKPNGETGNGYTSCCQACSCHPDCKKLRNCCYPEVESKEMLSDQSESMYKCLFTRLINPNSEILNTVPSYRTIVSTPTDGCVTSESMKDTASESTYQPTCDETNFAPWGTFYPAYSKDTGEIYKNLQCAYCHGANDAELFTPVLVCEKFYGSLRKITSLNEQLGVLLTGQLSPKCYIDFVYMDPSKLRNNRCFKRVIDSCHTNTVRFPYGTNYNKLDFETVKNLCETGLWSLVTTEKGIYRNVFCSLCGQPSRSYSLTCDDDALKTDDFSFTQVFDPRVVLQQIGNPLEHGKHPKVCLVKDRSKESDNCRRVYCPTGRVRDKGGNCVIVSSYMSSGGMIVQIKLTPVNDKIPTEKYQKIGKDGFMTKAVWPDHWKVVFAYRRKDGSDCSERAAFIVYLATQIGQPETILGDVKRSMKNQWEIDEASDSFTFSQSFLEYPLVPDSSIGINTNVPYWQKHDINMNSTKMFPDCALIAWDMFIRSNNYRRPPAAITNLFRCPQVQLNEHEFEIGYKGYYLKSNLTRSLLHEYEYDLIEIDDGYQARVCVLDTHFTIKTASSGPSLNECYIVLLLMLPTCRWLGVILL